MKDIYSCEGFEVISELGAALKETRKPQIGQLVEMSPAGLKHFSRWHYNYRGIGLVVNFGFTCSLGHCFKIVPLGQNSGGRFKGKYCMTAVMFPEQFWQVKEDQNIDQFDFPKEYWNRLILKYNLL